MRKKLTPLYNVEEDMLYHIGKIVALFSDRPDKQKILEISHILNEVWGVGYTNGELDAEYKQSIVK
jgi:hypothetical protein